MRREQHKVRARFGRTPRVARFAALASLALLVALCMGGCRATDFFTDIVISRDATIVDEDNPNATIINSPDAQETTDQLAALDWDSDAEQSEEVQNLVVYSKHPNTEFSTRHSLYAIVSNLEGVESSDPVKIVYSSTAKKDADVQAEDDNATSDTKSADEQQSEQKSTKKTTSTSKKGTKGSGGSSDKKDSTSGDSSKKDSGKKKKKDDAATTSNKKKKSSKTDESEGQSKDDQSTGTGTAKNVYDSSNKRAKIQSADQVAALGQAAVVVQSIGGEGALCAMDEWTYYGKMSDSESASWASSFKDVFGDELASGFENDALLWKEDGSFKGDLEDVDKLVEACGENGVIMFDQNEIADINAVFGKVQMEAINDAGIQFVPIDLTSVKGMKDAARAARDALKTSSKAKQDVSDTCDTYCNAIDALIEGAAATHGGGLAKTNSGSNGNTTLLSDDRDQPLSNYNFYGVQTLVASDFAKDVSFTLASTDKSMDKVDTSGGLLFSYCGYSASTTAYWMQVAGAVDRTASWDRIKQGNENPDDLRIVWQIPATYNKGQFSSSSGPFANLSSWWSSHSISSSEWCLLQADFSGNMSADDSNAAFLGSAKFPYLIVTATESQTASQVKTAVVKSINSKNGAYSHRYDGAYIGMYNNKKNNAFEDGVNAKDVVRENPSGCLGSWTNNVGSLESVLECVWAAKVYSQAPANSLYEPICDMDRFSGVEVGSESCDDLKSAVVAFYKEIYRMTDSEAQAAYRAVVTDEGVS